MHGLFAPAYRNVFKSFCSEQGVFRGMPKTSKEEAGELRQGAFVPTTHAGPPGQRSSGSAGCLGVH